MPQKDRHRTAPGAVYAWQVLRDKSMQAKAPNLTSRMTLHSSVKVMTRVLTACVTRFHVEDRTPSSYPLCHQVHVVIVCGVAACIRPCRACCRGRPPLAPMLSPTLSASCKSGMQQECPWAPALPWPALVPSEHATRLGARTTVCIRPNGHIERPTLHGLASGTSAGVHFRETSVLEQASGHRGSTTIETD